MSILMSGIKKADDYVRYVEKYVQKGKRESARQYIRYCFKFDPNHSGAHWLSFLLDENVKKGEDLIAYSEEEDLKRFKENNSFKQAVRFATPEQKSYYGSIIQSIQDKLLDHKVNKDLYIMQYYNYIAKEFKKMDYNQRRKVFYALNEPFLATMEFVKKFSLLLYIPLLFFCASYFVDSSELIIYLSFLIYVVYRFVLAIVIYPFYTGSLQSSSKTASVLSYSEFLNGRKDASRDWLYQLSKLNISIKFYVDVRLRGEN